MLFSQPSDAAVPPGPRPAAADSCADNAVCFKLHFANNSSELMRDYRDNASTLDKLDRIFATRELTTWVDSINIEGGASLVGGVDVNERLSRERSESAKSYILPRNTYINPGLIRTTYQVYNWSELKRLVTEDLQTPYRTEILQILSLPLDDASKQRQIALLGDGMADQYILTHFARYMRSVSGIIFYMNPETPAEYKAAMIADEEPQITIVSRDSLSLRPVEPTSPITETALEEELIAEEQPAAEVEPASYAVSTPALNTRKPLFALKTNLLFDALTAINFEVEVPIGKRWSVAGELIFPWWLNKGKQHCFQLMNGNLEGRYWFGEREKRPVMTGWFTGLYVGGGYYDLEWETKGYQGEFFIAAGVSGGYAHTINKKGNLRMEYSLGIGFMQTKYREYAPQQGGEVLMWQRDGKFTWFGPTRAKVSLVWLLDFKSKKGGVK